MGWRDEETSGSFRTGRAPPSGDGSRDRRGRYLSRSGPRGGPGSLGGSEETHDSTQPFPSLLDSPTRPSQGRPVDRDLWESRGLRLPPSPTSGGRRGTFRSRLVVLGYPTLGGPSVREPVGRAGGREARFRSVVDLLHVTRCDPVHRDSRGSPRVLTSPFSRLDPCQPLRWSRGRDRGVPDDSLQS